MSELSVFSLMSRQKIPLGLTVNLPPMSFILCPERSVAEKRTKVAMMLSDITLSYHSIYMTKIDVIDSNSELRNGSRIVV